MKNFFFGIFKIHPNEIQGLNGIRAIAFFMLMYVHIYRPYLFFGFHEENRFLDNFLNNGSLCMDAFFMLSGFLIGGQLLSEFQKKGKIHYRNFFVKRVFRIFPPYYIFITLQLFVLLQIAKVSPDARIVEGVASIKSKVIWDYLYMSDYFRGTMIHGWSLSVEEKFYLLLPLLLFLFRYLKNKNHQLILFFSLSLLPLGIRSFQYVYFGGSEGIDSTIYNQYFYYPFHSRMDSLFWGVFLAGIFTYYPERIKNYLQTKTSTYLTILSVFFLVLIMFFTNENNPGYFTTVLKFFIVSLLWSTLLLKCLDPVSITSKILSFRGFIPVAKLSYSAYIIHLVFLGILTNKFIGYEKLHYHQIFIWFIPIGFMILGIAYIYYLLAEKPFLLLREKFIAKNNKSVVL